MVGKSGGSRQIVISRVPIPGTYGTTVANNCNQIAALVTAAEDTVCNNRGVFNTTVQVVSTGSDVTEMTNRLDNPNVTAFYFYGHGTTDGNAIGTQTFAIYARAFTTMFGNRYYPALPARYGRFAGKPALVTQKPFNFVFLDGCNTALGDLPEAFGIAKRVSGSTLDDAHLHKRAFMGWTGPVTFQFDSSHIDWSLQFWTAWLDGGLADKSLTDAITAANQRDPSVLNNVPIKWYGNGSLKWSD